VMSPNMFDKLFGVIGSRGRSEDDASDPFVKCRS
jgi:hypothetical protein